MPDARPWDLDTLLHTDPRILSPLLDRAHDPQARLEAAVYRTSLDAHAARPGDRGWLLSLDSARWGATGLLSALTRDRPGWRPLWATGARVDGRLRLAWLETSWGASAEAVVVVEGRALVVAGGRDTASLRDLMTGERVGRRLEQPGPPPGLTSVAVAEMAGRPVVVADGRAPDGRTPTVEVWDAGTGEHVGSIPTGHAAGLTGVATAVVDGRAVAVTTGWDRVVEAHDLLTGDEICPPLLGTDTVHAATAVRHGRAVVVTTHGKGNRRVWWLRAGSPFIPAEGPVPSPAWCDVAVECEGGLRLRDPHTGEPSGPPIPYAGLSWGVHPATCDGRAVVVTGGSDGRIRVWDVEADRLPGVPLPGHAAEAREVTVVRGGGRTTVVSRDEEGCVWTRDASTGQPVELVDPADPTAPAERVGPPVTGRAARAVRVVVGEDRRATLHLLRGGLLQGPALGPALGPFAGTPKVAVTELDGVPVAFTGDRAGSVGMWDVRTGERLWPGLERPCGEVDAVAATTLDGRPIAVTGGGGPVWVWDLRTGRRLRPAIEAGEVKALAVTEFDGLPVLATGTRVGAYGEVGLWDLRTHEPLCSAARFPEPVHDLAWVPHGVLVVAFGHDVAAVRPPHVTA
ncbi:WD40 repeat domain-containing protein [Streptosporangium sp. NPDC051023]|uniref:WD40 repeat domain-containing protein n=1 Tax=Streptosporangium sp. NPDC051023 TaxID=3155410 RepID=UPI00344E6D55